MPPPSSSPERSLPPAAETSCPHQTNHPQHSSPPSAVLQSPAAVVPAPRAPLPPFSPLRHCPFPPPSTLRRDRPAVPSHPAAGSEAHPPPSPSTPAQSL